MDVIGGGAPLVVAAVLWMAYLVPSWLRRRQYMATERNAVRLQQTLRILAETSETPHEVELVATAREVARQRRLLAIRERTAERVARAEKIAAETVEMQAEAAEQRALVARRKAAEERAKLIAQAEEAERTRLAMEEKLMAKRGLAANTVAGKDDIARAKLTRKRLQRTQAVFTILLLVALATVAFGIAGLLVPSSGISPTLILFGSLGTIALLPIFARMARRRRVLSAAAVAASRSRMLIGPAASPQPAKRKSLPEPEFVDLAEPPAVETWTPRPLPTPLTLSRGTIAAAAMASVEAAAELRKSVTQAAEAERAAAAYIGVTRLRRMSAASNIASEPVGLAKRASAAKIQETNAVSAGSTGLSTGRGGRGAIAADPTSDEYSYLELADGQQPALGDLDAVLRRRRAG